MLLEVENLIKRFPVAGGFWGKTRNFVHAINGVSFQLEEGKTLGLVGESGCGKSTLARTLLRLYPADSGKILFEGENLATLSEKQLKPYRPHIQMIFQDPYSSLNPRMMVSTLLQEGLKLHTSLNRKEREEKVIELLEMVGLAPNVAHKYPHEFSGGQRQRIGIARALSLLPKLVVCDEPVSALDVSIQAQVLNLLKDLKAKLKLTYLFISHDLKVVSYLSDEIAVMYLGYIVEQFPVSELFKAKHPYTQALLEAVPIPSLKKRRRKILKGDVPSPLKLPSGCVFHTRCPYVEDICKREVPVLAGSKHRVACHLADKIPPVSIGE